MNAKPILFSAPMVRALLAGRKTQTRRIAALTDSGRVKAVGSPRNWHIDDPHAVLACPYGAPGDLLWVRETHCLGVVRAPDLPQIVYAADYAYNERPKIRWRPSIHMPRWASRLTLRITDVRVQRLQDISDADAKAEGVSPALTHATFGYCGLDVLNDQHQYARSFVGLWTRIHGNGAWESNPWVWVLTFDVYRNNVSEM